MKKLWVENNVDIPAIVWSETSPNENLFTDKTNDVLAWDKYGPQVLDLDRYRYEIKTPFYILAGGPMLPNWASLTDDIKKVGAKHFFVPYSLRLQVVTEQEDLANWEWLIIETQGTPTQIYKGRAKTFDEMRKCVAHKVRKELLSMTESQQMLKDVGQMADWFIRANSPDFKQWITNEVGSPYETNGFAQKTYYSESLKKELYEIYNGNY